MTDTSPALDRVRFEEATGGDRDLALELAELYLDTAEGYLSEMLRILDRDGDWSGPAHALKGASANLGISKMQKLAMQAEHSEPNAALMQELRAGLVEIRGVFEDQDG